MTGLNYAIKIIIDAKENNVSIDELVAGRTGRIIRIMRFEL